MHSITNYLTKYFKFPTLIIKIIINKVFRNTNATHKDISFRRSRGEKIGPEAIRLKGEKEDPVLSVVESARRGAKGDQARKRGTSFHKAILRTLFSHAHVESKARPISYGDSLTSSVHHRICLYRRRY